MGEGGADDRAEAFRFCLCMLFFPLIPDMFCCVFVMYFWVNLAVVEILNLLAHEVCDAGRKSNCDGSSVKERRRRPGLYYISLLSKNTK